MLMHEPVELAAQTVLVGPLVRVLDQRIEPLVTHLAFGLRLPPYRRRVVLRGQARTQNGQLASRQPRTRLATRRGRRLHLLRSHFREHHHTIRAQQAHQTIARITDKLSTRKLLLNNHFRINRHHTKPVKSRRYATLPSGAGAPDGETAR